MHKKDSSYIKYLQAEYKNFMWKCSILASSFKHFLRAYVPLDPIHILESVLYTPPRKTVRPCSYSCWI